MFSLTAAGLFVYNQIVLVSPGLLGTNQSQDQLNEKKSETFCLFQDQCAFLSGKNGSVCFLAQTEGMKVWEPGEDNTLLKMVCQNSWYFDHIVITSSTASHLWDKDWVFRKYMPDLAVSRIRGILKSNLNPIGRQLQRQRQRQEDF